MFFDGSLLACGTSMSPEMLCERSTLRERDKEEAGQGFGLLAPGTCWGYDGGKSAARPFGKETVWTVSKCQSETKGLAHPQDSQLLERQGVRFWGGQPHRERGQQPS